ncbi:hypothetical protein TWF481_010898 [Arthrobotrys musiformis]|uniref:Uncharacterized protein n=1 Tax=Arthrobotrys musiformis TaxID=47236 RepID=A0AAV9VX00_9PEZI
MSGKPLIPEGFEHAEFLLDPALRESLLSTGILWNADSNYIESGFWVAGRVFVTALYFNKWGASVPSDIELAPYINDQEQKFYVTDGACYGDEDLDPGCPRMYLHSYDIQRSLAIFRPVDSEFKAPTSIPLDHILERSEIQQITQPMASYDVFTSGSNGDLAESILNKSRDDYIDAIEVSGDIKERLRTPNFRKMLLPNTRSVTYRRAELFPDKNVLNSIATKAYKTEIGTTCPAWERLNKSYYVFGMLIGNGVDKMYNKGNFIPDGFKEGVRKLLAGQN